MAKVLEYKMQHNIDTILPIIYPIHDEFNIILANGEFPKQQILIDLLNNAKKLICCDGAINSLEKHNIKADYIIGDCDSIPTELQNKYKDSIIKIDDQNINDLSKALNLAVDLKLDNIIILGATGLREDHTLANIALLAKYSRLFTNIAIISDYGIFTAHQQNCKLATIPHQQISFFTLDPQVEISSSELKWQLDKLKLSAWNSGTLNEATTNYLNLQIAGEHSVIVYRAFCVK